MIFVDTGAWFAIVVPWDPNHRPAVEWLALHAEPLLTTDYVIDETLTLLRARGEDQRALDLGVEFFDAKSVRTEKVSEEDIRAAWTLFRE